MTHYDPMELALVLYGDKDCINLNILTWEVATIAIRLLAVSKAERNTMLKADLKQIYSYTWL